MQGLGATKPGKACADNRDGYRFFHRCNLGRVFKRGQARPLRTRSNHLNARELHSR
jgi:hypothetical protein